MSNIINDYENDFPIKHFTKSKAYQPNKIYEELDLQISEIMDESGSNMNRTKCNFDHL